MGTFILTDEDTSFLSEEYNKTGVYIGHPVDSDSNPVEAEVIGTKQSEKYKCGDRIKFDPNTLQEVSL
jgi:hypothetical protein